MDQRVINFLQGNKVELIQIYITERSSKGEGMLMITRVGEQMNVGYMAYYEMPEELQQELLRKKENNPKPSIIYFYVCSSPDNAQLFEIDLDDRN